MNHECMYNFTSIKNILTDVLSYFRYTLGRVLVKQPKLALYSTLITLVLAIISVFALKSNASLNAQAEYENSKYYTTITVESGDTLWSIAQEYRTVEYGTTQEYINEVKEINHITGDDITCGCYLTIPYYAMNPIED